MRHLSVLVEHDQVLKSISDGEARLSMGGADAGNDLMHLANNLAKNEQKVLFGLHQTKKKVGSKAKPKTAAPVADPDIDEQAKVVEQ